MSPARRWVGRVGLVLVLMMSACLWYRSRPSYSDEEVEGMEQRVAAARRELVEYCEGQSGLVALIDLEGPLRACVDAITSELRDDFARPAGRQGSPGVTLPESEEGIERLPLLPPRWEPDAAPASIGEARTRCAGLQPALAEALSAPVTRCGPLNPSTPLWAEGPGADDPPRRWPYALAHGIAVVAYAQPTADALDSLLDGLELMRRLRTGPTSASFATSCVQGEEVLWSALQSKLMSTDLPTPELLRRLRGRAAQLDSLLTAPRGTVQAEALMYFDFAAQQRGNERRDGMANAVGFLELGEAECPADADLVDCTQALPAEITAELDGALWQLIVGRGPYRDSILQYTVEWTAAFSRRFMELVTKGNDTARVGNLLLHLAAERAEGRCPSDASIPEELLSVAGSDAPIVIDGSNAPLYQVIAPAPSSPRHDLTRSAMVFVCSDVAADEP